ncbi:hypothetical protein [Microbispora sitophila]|uniref:hypothetical protein n=1 Tax=Microbispora sitophila TaxID=2771537 RepID=UPI001D010203|nr:hypothetical protein [Microbispora sitophila]
MSDSRTGSVTAASGRTEASNAAASSSAWARMPRAEPGRGRASGDGLSSVATNPRTTPISVAGGSARTPSNGVSSDRK